MELQRTVRAFLLLLARSDAIAGGLQDRAFGRRYVLLAHCPSVLRCLLCCFSRGSDRPLRVLNKDDLGVNDNGGCKTDADGSCDTGAGDITM